MASAVSARQAALDVAAEEELLGRARAEPEDEQREQHAGRAHALERALFATVELLGRVVPEYRAAS